MAEIKSPEECQKLVQEMRDWLNSQTHLPKDNIDDKLLLRFVHSCYYDVEKAKQAAELFFTLRSSAPDVLNNRDPYSPEMQNFLKYVNIGNLKISGNRNLWLWQLNDPGLDNYDYLLDCKLFFLSTDAWMLEDEQLEEADVVIMDVKDLSLKFLTKFNLSYARKCSKYQEDAMPIRLKQIHIINAPPVIDKIFGLIKPFLKQEMTSMFQFHPPKANNLSAYFTPEDLPKDYGGTRESMEELMAKSIALLARQRERLIDDSLWKLVDTKKSNSKTDTRKIEESFRSLAID